MQCPNCHNELVPRVSIFVRHYLKTCPTCDCAWIEQAEMKRFRDENGYGQDESFVPALFMEPKQCPSCDSATLELGTLGLLTVSGQHSAYRCSNCHGYFALNPELIERGN